MALKHTFFITATNTDVGKTFTTLKLMEFFASKGHKVGAFKPIETGVQSEPADGKILLKKAKELNKEFNSIDIKDIVPVTFKLPAAPYVAKGDSIIEFKKIEKAYKKISKVCDTLFIEGAGGLLVPVKKDFFMADFIRFFNAKALLVTHAKLGCINDTLLSLNYLKSNQIPYNWCINVRKNEKNDFLVITLPYYKKVFKEVLVLQSNIETIYKNLTLFSDINHFFSKKIL